MLIEEILQRSGGLDWQLASFGSHIDVRASNSHSGDLTFDLNPSLDLGPREPPKVGFNFLHLVSPSRLLICNA